MSLQDDDGVMKPYLAVRYHDGSQEPADLLLIAEEPFMIRIDEAPYSVVMRTPGEEVFHAAGFCLAEGIIDSRDDMEILHCPKLEQNVVDVRLTPERRKRIPDVLKRRGFVSQTSCGICGKQMIEEMFQKVTPLDDGFEIRADSIPRCIGALAEHQRCYEATRGSHAALILDGQLNAIACAEDVGRHNALDKSIGKALMNRQLSNARILVLSSRVSHELVQKAARAKIPMIVSYSRPTSLAVQMAKELDMTLVCPDTDPGLVVFGNKDRITVD
jgi:FdhD protein